MINLGLKHKNVKVCKDGIMIIYMEDFNKTEDLEIEKITKFTTVYIIGKTPKDMVKLSKVLDVLDNRTLHDDDINFTTVVPVIMYVPVEDDYEDLLDSIDCNGWFPDLTVNKFTFINKKPLQLSEDILISTEFTNNDCGITVNHKEEYTEISVITNTDMISNVKLVMEIC